jgi:hypothetical protein
MPGTPSAVERLYIIGKRILKASADGKLDDQREKLRDEWIAAVADCYRALGPNVISFGDLKTALQPVERAGLEFLKSRSTAETNTRFHVFADCLEDLYELRIVASTTQQTVSKAGRPKRGQPSVNARLLDLWTRTPEAKTWSIKKMADTIGCARSSIKDCEAFQKLAEIRRLARAERQLDKAKKTGQAG